MPVLVLGGIALVVFVVAVAVLGVWLRLRPSRELAERSSRVAHFLFFVCLGLPVLISLAWPGITQLDPLVGFSPLPLPPARIITGVALAIPGLYFMAASNLALRTLGSGANAFRLTRRIVRANVYEQTRNPMSFGYYLLAFGIALMSGSTVLTLYVLVGIIPAHLFFLLFFESRELDLRFGEAYRAYRARVPFMFPRMGGGSAPIA